MGESIGMTEVTRLQYFLCTLDVSKWNRREHYGCTEWIYNGKCMAQMIYSNGKSAFWLDNSLLK